MRVTAITSTEVTIRSEAVELNGTLSVPENARGVVIFAHGSGSSRFSPRNRHVAEGLHEGRLATLLLDLLTAAEERVDERTHHLRFDIELLARRLAGASDWLNGTELRHLGRGYFGASTGAGAALVAAAGHPESVDAIVSRGGRPDLAGPALALVTAPTLLIVGGHDYGVIELNRGALEQLRALKKMEIVPGATHLFEESGALDEVTRLSRDWFIRYLGRRDPEE